MVFRTRDRVPDTTAVVLLDAGLLLQPKKRSGKHRGQGLFFPIATVVVTPTLGAIGCDAQI